MVSTRTSGTDAHDHAPPEDAALQGVLSPAHLLTTLGTCALVFLAAFEAMAITTVMPLVARDLNGTALYALAFAGPLASGVVGMVLAGAWTDRRGPALPLFASTGVFALGLLVAGLAQSMPVFLAGRLIQGFGGGAINVVLYVLVARSYPAALHPKIFAAFSAAWVVPSMVGPFCAGLVAQYLSWHWVFLGVVFLVIPALAMLVPALRRLAAREQVDDGGAPAAPGDLTSQQLTADPAASRGTGARAGFAAVVALAVLGLNLSVEVGQWSWLVALAAVVLALVTVRKLLPSGVLTGRRGLPSVIMMKFLAGAAFFGAEVYVPYVLMDRHGFEPSTAGLALTFSAVAWSVGSAVQGRLSARMNDAAFVRLGALFLVVAIVTVLAATVGDWHPAALIAGWLLAGAGMGVMSPRLSVLVLAFSNPGNQGFNGSAANVADSLGAALSLAATGLVFHVLGSGEAFAGVFALTGAVAVLGASVAGRVRTHPAP
ncbi:MULTISPECIES: MFS transporter [Arthrobacter]|uniref:MFS transporter n=2 Tax=Arthrobacter TaxID=1663 RepID=A0ABU9KLX3_9MICC|nr:MFS transporter [Arthrobacter sp. YJM1]MDP5228181.1 MFS transporter [Arthrobacter sp. YJM1]